MNSNISNKNTAIPRIFIMNGRILQQRHPSDVACVGWNGRKHVDNWLGTEEVKPGRSYNWVWTFLNGLHHKEKNTGDERQMDGANILPSVVGGKGGKHVDN